MRMTNLNKALLVANGRVAILQGASRVWCDRGEFNCDIPGYFGYGSGMMALRKAADDLGVDYTFLDSDADNIKFHVTAPLDNGALLGLTVPLPMGDEDAMQVAVITTLHVYWLTKQNKTKNVSNLITELAQAFDVSFGAGQAAAAE